MRRMIKRSAMIFAVLIALCWPAWAVGENGLVKVQSSQSVSETADRLEAVLTEKGMTVMARIDHRDNAAGVDLSLRPTEVVIFGNPKVGTLLMQCAQSVAIDLPQKALVWEDEAGQVWLAYNDPKYLKSRHGIDGCDEVLTKISGALGNFAEAATR